MTLFKWPTPIIGTDLKPRHIAVCEMSRAHISGRATVWYDGSGAIALCSTSTEKSVSGAYPVPHNMNIGKITSC